MQPARELPQLAMRLLELGRGGREQLLGGSVGLHARDLEQVRDREQPLLRAIVEVAPTRRRSASAASITRARDASSARA